MHKRYIASICHANAKSATKQRSFLRSVWRAKIDGAPIAMSSMVRVLVRFAEIRRIRRLDAGVPVIRSLGHSGDRFGFVDSEKKIYNK